MIKGRVNVKTIIVVVILLLVLALTVLLINAARTYITGAAAGAEPKNVLATPDESGKSAIVSWTTDKATSGVVEYGTTPASLVLRAVESDQTSDHRVSLAPLKANTSYYFRIRVGEEIFDNGGIPYSFKTKASSETGQDSETMPVEGQAIGGDAAIPGQADSTMGNGTTVSGTTTINTDPMAMPSQAATGTGTGQNACNRTTDYNGDGVVNTMDYVTCLSKGSTPGSSGSVVSAAPTATAVVPTPGGACIAGVDYDGNGTINTMDLIKCKSSTGGATASPSAGVSP